MAAPKIRVAICGGGIGGLCLAVALSKYPHIQVDVFEAAGRFSEIGAGVMIWQRTWHILGLLGLEQPLSKVTDSKLVPEMGFDYRRSDRADGFHFHFVSMPFGCIRFHRAHFLDAFIHNLPDGVAHFGKRLASFAKVEDGVQLNFGDGSSALCDLLVGCDGIKSTVRPQMLRDAMSGSIAYRALIPVSDLPGEAIPRHRSLVHPVMYLGQNKHIVVYSISRGTVINVVAYSTDLDKENSVYGSEWVTDCSKEEMLECFSGWESDVSLLLERVDKPTKWGIHDIAPLPFYAAGRVVLLGDAAHAMTPHLGSGAGQAIEDAYILSNVLGASTLNTLDAAIKAYEETRLPVANHVARASVVAGRMFEFNNEEFGEEYSALGPAIGKQWGFLYESTPESEVDKALNLLSSRVIA